MADDKLKIVATVEDQFTGPLSKLEKGLKSVGDETAKQGASWKKDWEGVRGEVSKFQGVLRGFDPILSAVGVGSFGAAMSIAGMVTAVKNFSGQTRDLSQMGRQIGMTVDQLRTLGSLGEKFGVSADAMRGAIGQFANNMVDLRQRWGQVYGELKNMNLGHLAEELVNAPSMEAAVETAMKALQNIPDSMKAARVSTLIFGTPDMATISRSITGKISDALKQTQADIGHLDKETEEAARHFEEHFSRIGRAAEKAKLKVLGPVLRNVAGALDQMDAAATDPEGEQLKRLKESRQSADNAVKAAPFGTGWYFERQRDSLDQEIARLEKRRAAPAASAVEDKLGSAKAELDYYRNRRLTKDPVREKDLADEIRRLTEELRRLRENGSGTPTVQQQSFNSGGALGGGSLVQKAAWGGFGGSSGNNAGIPSYGSPGGSGGSSNSPNAPVPIAGAIQRGSGALTPNAGPLGATPEAQSPGAYFGQDVDVSRLPAGMRNNNPGNLKYSGSDWQKRNFPGMVGPSQNTDQGSPQIVFNSPEAGMRAAARLALGKFDGGSDTLQKLIAGQNGWTPGHPTAPGNIAKTMGIGPNDKLNLRDPAQMQKFLRGLLWQEHGPSNLLYKDETLQRAAEAALGRTGAAGGSGPLTRSGDDVPSVDGIGGVDQRQGAGIRRQAITDELRNQLAKAAREAGVNTEIYSGGQDAHGSHRTGSHRHDGGRSADVRLYTTGPNGERRYLSMNDPSDRKVMERFIRGTVRYGATGVGAGPGYMGEHGIHIGGGEPSAWGAGGRSANAPDWVRRAHRQGLADHEAAQREAARAKADAAPSQNERVGDALMDRFYGKGAANAGPAMQMPGGSGVVGKGSLHIKVDGPPGTQVKHDMSDLFGDTKVSRGKSQMSMAEA